MQGSVWKTGRAGPGQEGGSGPPTISAQTPYSSPNFEPTNCCTSYQKATAYPQPPTTKKQILSSLATMIGLSSLQYGPFCVVIPPRAPKGLLPDSLHNYATMVEYASKTLDKWLRKEVKPIS